jgi:hypothetical protein
MSYALERTAFSVLQASQTFLLTNQVADAILVTPGPDDTVDDLPKIFWPNPAGRRFILEGHLHKAKTRGRRTWIKDHGWFLTELQANNTEIDAIWACGHCARAGKGIFYKAQSTSNAIDHLKR